MLSFYLPFYFIRHEENIFYRMISRPSAHYTYTHNLIKQQKIKKTLFAHHRKVSSSSFFSLASHEEESRIPFPCVGVAAKAVVFLPYQNVIIALPSLSGGGRGGKKVFLSATSHDYSEEAFLFLVPFRALTGGCMEP